MSESQNATAGAVTTCGECGFSCFSEELDVGIRDFALSLLVDGIEQRVVYDQIEDTDEQIVAEGTVGNGSLRCRTTARPVLHGAAIVIEHVLINSTDRPITVSEIRWGQLGDEAGVRVGKVALWDVRYCHTDNVRIERYPHCDTVYPYVRPIPVAPTRLGIGQDQPFPAIYLTDRRYRLGVVIGTTSQEKCFPSWEVCKGSSGSQGVFETFLLRFDLPQAREIAIEPNAEQSLEGIFVQIVQDRHPQDAYTDYIDYLGGEHEFRGHRTRLRTYALHCTWNYGVFDRQYEGDLLKTARFMSENFPRIRYFLMDAGYLFPSDDGSSTLRSNLSDRFYPDVNAAVCADKFPQGIPHYTAELRKLGLKPGIWWSPTVRVDSQLCEDHPDWFLQNANGGFYLIGESQGFLDLTVPGAREYLDHVLSVVLGEWDMEALKMDFWSQMFEDRRGLLSGANQTAVDTRKILFELIRKHLPDDGVFMTCVATGMGNPFVAEYADTYRNTIDIGVGVWDEQIRNCYWALPTLLIEGRKTFLLNNDSVGVNLAAPANENYFRLTWSYMHMGMIETGGRLEELPEHFVKAMRKLTDRCDRGYGVRCPDERAFTGEPLPEALYVDFPPDSQTHELGVMQSVALFNWTDEPKIISVRREDLGHNSPVLAEDFWTEEQETWADEFVVKRLDARSALLFDIKRD